MTATMTATASKTTEEIEDTEEIEIATKIEDLHQDTPMTLMITNATAAKDKVPRVLLITAFLLIRPFRISNSVMSSAMTRLNQTDTARLKTTESLILVMLVPDPTKEPIP